MTHHFSVRCSQKRALTTDRSIAGKVGQLDTSEVLALATTLSGAPSAQTLCRAKRSDHAVTIPASRSVSIPMRRTGGPRAK